MCLRCGLQIDHQGLGGLESLMLQATALGEFGASFASLVFGVNRIVSYELYGTDENDNKKFPANLPTPPLPQMMKYISTEYQGYRLIKMQFQMFKYIASK